jgi:hypothetical protein
MGEAVDAILIQLSLQEERTVLFAVFIFSKREQSHSRESPVTRPGSFSNF